MLKCVSPIDGRVFAERPVADPEQASAAVAAARAAQVRWREVPLADRVAVVRKGVEALVADRDGAAEELAWMMGRPVRYGGEFGGVTERATYMADIAEKALAPLVIESSAAYRRAITREPHGVVFVIAPWNYPYLTAINTIVPALIAGNAVLIKPATQTLLSGERMVRGFREAGLPEGLFQNIFLNHATTNALIAARAFDFINFTGSVDGGRAIERAAAGTFTPLGLELGGKDPAYVMEDADLDAAVASLMDGAFYNSGQCCCGIERIYVAPALFDAFVEKSVAEVEKLRLGNPLDHDTTLGPMAHPRFAAEVRAQVGEALAAGARALIDPAVFPADDRSAYLAPQILVDVTHGMRVMRDESFGPVVGIMKADSDTAALALMNDSAFGLTASLWTRDVERAGRLAGRIETGTVFMNRCDYLDPAVCWTGCKDTGRGATLSELGYHSLTRPKSHHFRLPA
ncbi:aldehyde dehydrogenase family protein [Xanthobacter aminoxidans]|uniref:aldehyde dehydrogenase family protein n=1 Tax=Xanthobacter aminoxidans TaxID=186280 RepID=UPI00202303BF|nr:aldehyde dehydrogenase family protein [Xanthobacter aminoxidans]MCL8385786.1 aldehyde dehydrogenase family protein [Xanthobacter aminoxidans]